MAITNRQKHTKFEDREIFKMNRKLRPTKPSQKIKDEQKRFMEEEMEQDIEQF